MRSTHLSLKKRIQQNQSGFTLTETVVVVSIIGILSVAAIGSFVAMRPTRNMHSYGRGLIADAQMAKLEAVKRNTCVGISFDLVRGGYWVFTDDGTGGAPAQRCDGQMLDLAGNDEADGHPFFPARFVAVPGGVTIALSPVPATAPADPNYRGPTDYDLFDSLSFNSRSMVVPLPPALIPFNGRAIVLRNDPNPADATWWGRVVVNSLGGSMEYQTNNIPANQANWSE